MSSNQPVKSVAFLPGGTSPWQTTTGSSFPMSGAYGSRPFPVLRSGLSASELNRGFPADDFIPPATDNAKTDTIKPASHSRWGTTFGFLFPALALPSSLVLVGSRLLGLQSKLVPKTVNGKTQYDTVQFLKPNRLTQSFAKTMGLTESRLIRATGVANKTLAFGIIPKALIGLAYGVQCGQPSIVMSKLAELSLVPLILRNNPLATTATALLGALFTFGFANDNLRRDINAGKLDGTIRQYDMTDFKAIFNPHAHLSIAHRIIGLPIQLVKMAGFSLHDHLLAIKHVATDTNKALHGEKNELTSAKGSGSSKSQAAAMLTYMGALPLMVTQLMGKDIAGLPKFSRVMGTAGALVGDLAFTLMALKGNNVFEKLPALGTTMENAGTISGYVGRGQSNATSTALQQMGAAVTSLFFAYRASEGKQSS